MWQPPQNWSRLEEKQEAKKDPNRKNRALQLSCSCPLVQDASIFGAQNEGKKHEVPLSQGEKGVARAKYLGRTRSLLTMYDLRLIKPGITKFCPLLVLV